MSKGITLVFERERKREFGECKLQRKCIEHLRVNEKDTERERESVRVEKR